MKNVARISLIFLLAANLTSHAAPLVYDEVDDGDLAPFTTLDLDVGVNTIRGRSCSVFGGSGTVCSLGVDQDTFNFNLEQGQTLTTATLRIFDVAAEGLSDGVRVQGDFHINSADGTARMQIVQPSGAAGIFLEALIGTGGSSETVALSSPFSIPGLLPLPDFAGPLGLNAGPTSSFGITPGIPANLAFSWEATIEIAGVPDVPAPPRQITIDVNATPTFFSEQGSVTSDGSIGLDVPISTSISFDLPNNLTSPFPANIEMQFGNYSIIDTIEVNAQVFSTSDLIRLNFDASITDQNFEGQLFENGVVITDLSRFNSSNEFDFALEFRNLGATPENVNELLLAGNFDIDHNLFFNLDGFANGVQAFILASALPCNDPRVSYSECPANGNESPTADAGMDLAGRPGDTVSLDGTASFDDNTLSAALQYSWTILSAPLGSVSELQNATTATPSLLVDVAGTYEIELIVTDEDSLDSVPDTVLISSENLAPIAVAGFNQFVLVGSTVTLDGSASTDPEMDELLYLWSIDTQPVGSLVDLVAPDTSTPSFTPDLIGEYEVSLTVSDFIGPGAPDSVVITAVSTEDFAQLEILEASDALVSVPPANMTTEGNQTALGNFLQQAIVAIQRGDTPKAVDKLQKAIARTDGCVLRTEPDGDGPERDWVTNCTDQGILYESLTSALQALQQ